MRPCLRRYRLLCFILFFMSHLTKKAELASTFLAYYLTAMKSAPSATEPVATDETSSKSAVFVTITIVVSSRPASVITELSKVAKTSPFLMR